MTTARQRIVALLRKLRLLPLADRAALLGSVLKNHRANRRFLRVHQGFPVPPAPLAFDAYNHTNWQRYYEMGIAHARLVATLVREHLAARPLRICEWGCGPARVIRHLRAMLPDRAVELVGTDSNLRSIRWCRENIAAIDFRENRPEPPLGFPPQSFDAVYALSVFTHLCEEAHFRWMRELFRVVKEAGIVIFSTHGDACAANLLAEERRRYEAGELVVRGGVAEGRKCFVAYHPPQFVRARLLADAEVLTFLPSPQLHGMIQDVWVVRTKQP